MHISAISGLHKVVETIFLRSLLSLEMTAHQQECIFVMESSKFSSLVSILVCFEKIPKTQLFFDLDSHGIRLSIHQQETIKLASLFLAARDHFCSYQCLVNENAGSFVIKKSLTDVILAFTFMQDVLRTTKAVSACTDGIRIHFDGQTSAISVALNATIATASPFECQYSLKGEHFDADFYQNHPQIHSIDQEIAVKTVLRSNLFVNCITEIVGGMLEEVQVEFHFKSSSEPEPFAILISSPYAASKISISTCAAPTDGNPVMCELYQCNRETNVKIEGKKLLAFRELLRCSSKVSLSLFVAGEDGAGELFLAQLMIPFGSGATAFVEYELICTAI